MTLCLFTTLTEAGKYPPARLARMYGWRWPVELHLRTVKATLGLDQLEVKSADVAQKEFYAGLMAYKLGRGLMGVAAQAAECAGGGDAVAGPSCASKSDGRGCHDGRRRGRANRGRNGTSRKSSRPSAAPTPTSATQKLVALG